MQISHKHSRCTWNARKTILFLKRDMTSKLKISKKLITVPYSGHTEKYV